MEPGGEESFELGWVAALSQNYVSPALAKLESFLRFFSVYSKIGAAKQALDEGNFWIDNVDEGLEESDIEQGLSEDESEEASTRCSQSSVLEFDEIDEDNYLDEYSDEHFHDNGEEVY